MFSSKANFIWHPPLKTEKTLKVVKTAAGLLTKNQKTRKKIKRKR